MRSPNNVREVQRLNDRMVALSRFLSASGNKRYPYFQCLRKNDHFIWSAKCEEAFRNLKEYITNPPTLSKPTPKLPIRLYFLITNRAISVVILKDRRKTKKPIYFVSKILPGAEARYQTIAFIDITFRVSPF